MGYRNPIVISLFLWLAFMPRAGLAAAVNTPEDIWKSLENLPVAERRINSSKSEEGN